MQVYSPEVLLTFGQALVSLLRNVSLYMRAMEAAGLPHDAGEWLPRLVFLLLQNPLNGTLPSLLELFPINTTSAPCVPNGTPV